MPARNPSIAPEPLAISKACVMGASGLLGSAFTRSLEADGIEVVEFSRRPGGGRAHWNPERGEIDAERLEGADAIVNLAGTPLDGERWTEARKRELWTSRVASTALLARTLGSLERKPEVLVNASAIGFYGDRPSEAVDEHSPAGSGYVADLCKAWEQATGAAYDAGIRVVLLRFGVVLTPRGGALARMLTPFRLGLGGRIGTGRQSMPWIALSDAVNVMRFVIANKQLSGPINAVAPEATRNIDMTHALGRVLGRPTLFPVPTFALRSMFGEEMTREVLLSGANVRPRALEESGYRFDYPRLDDALESMLGRSGGPVA